MVRLPETERDARSEQIRTLQGFQGGVPMQWNTKTGEAVATTINKLLLTRPHVNLTHVLTQSQVYRCPTVELVMEMVIPPPQSLFLQTQWKQVAQKHNIVNIYTPTTPHLLVTPTKASYAEQVHMVLEHVSSRDRKACPETRGCWRETEITATEHARMYLRRKSTPYCADIHCIESIGKQIVYHPSKQGTPSCVEIEQRDPCVDWFSKQSMHNIATLQDHDTGGMADDETENNVMMSPKTYWVLRGSIRLCDLLGTEPSKHIKTERLVALEGLLRSFSESIGTSAVQPQTNSQETAAPGSKKRARH
jgi:hypothetical protein